MLAETIPSPGLAPTIIIRSTKPSVSACVVWLQAIAATGKIVKSNPKHLEALQLRGMAYMYLGDHDLAKRHFGEQASFAPSSTLALLLECWRAAMRHLVGPLQGGVLHVDTFAYNKSGIVLSIS